jgi:hypothetical protein
MEISVQVVMLLFRLMWCEERKEKKEEGNIIFHSMITMTKQTSNNHNIGSCDPSDHSSSSRGACSHEIMQKESVEFVDISGTTAHTSKYENASVSD